MKPATSERRLLRLNRTFEAIIRTDVTSMSKNPGIIPTCLEEIFVTFFDFQDWFDR